jgi:hypothetical protein
MATQVVIPSRFESLVDSPQLKLQPTLVKVDSDLKAFAYLANKVQTQAGGVLAFVLGSTGVGKSTAVFAASVYLGDLFAPLFRVPPTIELRVAANWLQQNLPSRGLKVIPVLFDGREVTDDAVGLKQFLAALNQLLRARGDIVFLWPTTDAEWHKEIRTTAVTIGGTNMVPADADVSITGPDKAEWPTVLERILIQLDSSLPEVGIDTALVQQIAENSPTIGEFLSQIGTVIAQRTTQLREIKALPAVLFVVSSGPEVAGEANRLRRAGTYILKAEELIAYSPRSEAGKWWQERQKQPEQNLSYIISLFNARLATMSAGAVAYACIHNGTEQLVGVAKAAGMAPNTTNAATTLKATDLFRLLNGQQTNELSSSRKGKTKDTTLEAFSGIQALSAQNHRSINETIVKSLAAELPSIDLTKTCFEVDGGSQNLYTDELSLEFHHLSEPNCKASSMASYIMDKLRSYAVHYNLAPR